MDRKKKRRILFQTAALVFCLGGLTQAVIWYVDGKAFVLGIFVWLMFTFGLVGLALFEK